MAYTRIHAIKTTVHKSIAYICNPDKTEGELLISSFACDAKFARYQFQDALSKARNYSDDNKAYHLIQSFAPGEVSPEEAHRIGIELAERLLKGDYSYVIATHTDRQHPHIIIKRNGDKEDQASPAEYPEKDRFKQGTDRYFTGEIPK